MHAPRAHLVETAGKHHAVGTHGGELVSRVAPHHAEQVHEAITGSRLQVLEGPGSSHALALERQEEFLDLAMAFLKLQP